MKKSMLAGLVVAFALIVAAWTPVSAQPMNNEVRVASLVEEMSSLSLAKLEELPAITVKPYTIPGSSVDVMRVRLEETYTIDGIGEDTVELIGWIAVRHSNARPAPGFNTVSWETAVIDTEFVGLHLEGESELFGPVKVTLDSERPAIGKVGAIRVPEAASRILLVANGDTGATTDTKADSGTQIDGAEVCASTCNCRAPVNVAVAMPELGLEMKTKEPAIWYSKVNTIPPVGHQASVTIEPVAMVSGDREVGSLLSGTVKFREVVRAEKLTDDLPPLQVASTGNVAGR